MEAPKYCYIQYTHAGETHKSLSPHYLREEHSTHDTFWYEVARGAWGFQAKYVNGDLIVHKSPVDSHVGGILKEITEEEFDNYD